MSDYEEDIFFDEEDKETHRGEVVSEDDFDDAPGEMTQPGKEKGERYQSIVDVEEDEFRSDYDLEEDPEMDDFEELDEVEEIEEL